MKHHATVAFWDAYERLPPHVRSVADRNFDLLKRDPYHPSLHLPVIPHLKMFDKDWWMWTGSC